MPLKYFSVIIFLFLFVYTVCGQTSPVVLDTINIYKNKTGVSFDIYKLFWFSKRGTYEWNPRKMNSQDSLVMVDTLPHYFKVYESKNTLLFTGIRTSGFELRGDIRYYYKNGNVKRVEHWDDSQYTDSCNNTKITFNDGVGPEGCWKYYRKNGKLKEQHNYIIKIYSYNPISWCNILQITKLKKNGEIKSVKEKKIK